MSELPEWRPTNVASSKRQREGEDGNETIGLPKIKKVHVDVAEPVCDEEFWYEDGTIILVARDAHFRVYKGVLAGHSPVFADMFSLGSRSSLHRATAADCPNVYLEDSPEDLRHILRALLPKKSAGFIEIADNYPTFHVISAYARLGHKYQIHVLLNQSVSYLKKCFPTDFDARQEWLSDNYNQVPDEWGGPEPNLFAIGVVNIARLVQAETILPSALAVCCCLRAEQLVAGFEREDGTRERLNEADLTLCIAGMRQLTYEASAAIVTAFARFSPRGCEAKTACRQAIQDLLRDYTEEAPYFPVDNPFRDWDSWITEFWKEDRVCEQCLSDVLERFRTQQRRMWARLPYIFNIDADGWPEQEAERGVCE